MYKGDLEMEARERGEIPRERTLCSFEHRFARQGTRGNPPDMTSDPAMKDNTCMKKEELQKLLSENSWVPTGHTRAQMGARVKCWDPEEALVADRVVGAALPMHRSITKCVSYTPQSVKPGGSAPGPSKQHA